MTWTITRLVGCDHIRSIANADLVPILNSSGPDGELTGPGRPGKMRIAFVALNSDLRETGDPDPNRVMSLLVDSGIPFQSPPLALADGVAGYLDGAPLDFSAVYPIVNITPLSTLVSTSRSWDAKLYLIYTLSTGATLIPAGVTPFNPSTDCIGLTFGVAAFADGEGPVPGAFLIEIDFSHSIAS